MNILTGIRAFHYTACYGSITTAAFAMEVSQPTVSAQVKALERQFGVQLFARVGRRLVLTEFGERLYLTTNRLFRLEEEARDLLLEAKGIKRGHIRIGAVGPFNVMKIISAFRRTYSNVFVTLSVGDSADIMDQILNYRCDIGLLVHDAQEEGIVSMPFRRQPLLIFAHRNHPLLGRQPLCLADLDGQDFVMREVGSTTRRVCEELFKERGISVNMVMEIGSRECVREAVANGIGLGVVSDIGYVPDERLRVLDVDDFEAFTHSHLIYRSDSKHSNLIKAFLRIADKVRAELSEKSVV